MDPPELVIEITSPGREDVDHLTKLGIYMGWGIEFYVILDRTTNEIRLVDQSGRDDQFDADGKVVTITNNLEIAWDGSDSGFKAWWKGEQLERNKALLNQARQAIEIEQREKEKAWEEITWLKSRLERNGN